MNKHALPKLPYAFDALEPYIDARTMEIHYAKHHQTYTDKFNVALEKYPELFEKNPSDLLKDLLRIPEDIRNAVQNHGGGFVNHSFFWSCLTPTSTYAPPSEALRKILSNAFGSVDSFQEQFTSLALTLFGSGWVWLVQKDNALEIVATQNQDTPLSSGATPLLALDVWEHAYYLKHQNKRADYIKDWWHVVNWEAVEKNMHF